MAKETLNFGGSVEGHNDWVTGIAVCPNLESRLVTCSRDKTIVVWNVSNDRNVDLHPSTSLHGHSHFVEDVVISSDGQFVLSGSWDATMRLWDLTTGKTSKRFVGHKKDILSVAFSHDNRQIISGSRDKDIRLWNTLGDCKWTLEGHNDWVSCVRFSPPTEKPFVVSSSWDKKIKVWDITDCKLKTDLVGHTAYANSVTIAPDGSLCASGGKDKMAILWDLNDSKRLYDLPAGGIIYSLSFSPTRYWLVAATDKAIKIWDLETKAVLEELTPTDFTDAGGNKDKMPICTSFAWSADGDTLYAGYSDGKIRYWNVSKNEQF